MANTYVLTRAYGLLTEWGSQAVKAKTPSIPYLGSIERTMSVALLSGKKVLLLQKLRLEAGTNGGIQLQWETTDRVDVSTFGLGRWFYQGQEVETEALALLAPEAVNNAAYLTREADDVPALGSIAYRQHVISQARDQGSYQLNEPCLWVPGNPHSDSEMWGPNFIEAMVSGIGPWNVKAFEKFRDLVKDLFGQNPLRVYRSGEFACRSDYFHEALIKGPHGTKYQDLLRFVRTNSHSALLDRKVYGWLAASGKDTQERFRGYVPWWLHSNPEEILQVPSEDLFLVGRRVDTARLDTDAWFAASKLGIVSGKLEDFNNKQVRRCRANKQLAPQSVSGSSMQIEVKPEEEVINNDSVIAALKNSNNQLKGGLEPVR